MPKYLHEFFSAILDLHVEIYKVRNLFENCRIIFELKEELENFPSFPGLIYNEFIYM